MITNYKYLLKYRAHTHPERVALIYKEEYITYYQLNCYAIQSALWFSDNGIKNGDRIGFIDFNNSKYVHLINGCLISGIIPVSINWRCTSSEIAFILQDAGCKMLLHGEHFLNLAENSIAGNKIIIKEIESLGNKIFSEIKNNIFEVQDVKEDDIALLIYTSGTTGMPKGVKLNYQNMYSMYLSLRYETPLFGPASINLIAAPWYAVVGIGYFIFGIYTGCTNVLMQYFDPIETCSLIEKHKITNAFFAPVMMQVICSLDEISEYNLSSLQSIQYGGSPISSAQLKVCYETFKCYFTQGYGLTETSGIGTALRYDDHELILFNDDNESKQLLLSAGKPYPGVEIKIMNDIGIELPTNEIGEIYLKGKVLAMGYWNSSGANEKIFKPDGWLLTGDLGYLSDNGYLFLVDRKNDLIITKGINIYPAEIELVLAQHPLIKECAVIATPHEIYGENICAVVVLLKESLQLSELRFWAKDKLADYKLPARLEIIEILPRNQTGKILRKDLRTIYK